MDLQLIEADSGELRKQMDKYKLYVVYYSYFIIQPDMLMSKHAILIFLNKEDQISVMGIKWNFYWHELAFKRYTFET